MVDLKRTLDLLSGGLFDSEKTWQSFLPDAANWQNTAVLLTAPLIVIGALGAYLIGLISSDASFFGRFRPTLMSTVVAMITSAGAAVIIAFIFSAMAGAFGGKNKFALGLAATTFAFIPGYIGQAVMWLPWVGGLLSIGLFIYGMILLWKIIPVYLEVSEEKRIGHYILSLLASIVALVILSTILGGSLMPSFGDRSVAGFSDATRPGSAASSGMFGGLARQGELLSAAEEDRYDPPDHGRLSKRQVREFIRVMQRTEEIQAEKMADLKQLAEKTEKDQDVSFSDLGRMMEGAAEVSGLPTTEIEVVKTAGGNWAEHQWVRESLRTARIQKDINPDIAHNYDLYQDFEDELSNFIRR